MGATTMADETLRLPNTIFQAVFDLGDKSAAKIPLPEALSEPEVFAEWHDDERTVALFVDYVDGQLHLDVSESNVSHHFHDVTGSATERSPWGRRDTEGLLNWAVTLGQNYFARMPALMDDIAEAAAWHEAGFPLYVCETEPAFLDLIEVEIEGEILTLPWLGSGQVVDEHVEGDNHPIALLWNGDHDTPDQIIARAWLEPSTGDAVTAAEPGVDWDAVGLPQHEVLTWLEGNYVNHHVTADAEMELISAVLERMGGLDAVDPAD
jgi:hypothetical protein